MDATDASTSFRSLQLADWRQFDRLDIDFHPRLTIITGANGSGKTGILRLLARHFRWSFDELSIPQFDKLLGGLRYLIGMSESRGLLELLLGERPNDPDVIRFNDLVAQLYSERTQYGRGYQADPAHERIIGFIKYGGTDPEQVASLKVPLNPQSPTYHPYIQPHVYISGGLFFPSHRSEFVYRQVAWIPLEGESIGSASTKVEEAMRTRALYQTSSDVQPVNFYMKQALLSWSIFGVGNEVVLPNPAQRHYFEMFQEVMRIVLPPTLGFQRLEIRTPEVVLVTETGDFTLDAVSGGIGAILELAWQLFVADPTRQSHFPVVVDEIENHLHASMQRSILPSLLEAFPNIQFIVSTHSPLAVGSVRDCAVYALRYNDVHRVTSEALSLDERAGTATEILREVLGVPVSAPIWVEEYLDEVARKYQEADLSNDLFDSIRRDLALQGLEEFAPQTIADVVSQRT